MTSFSHHLIPLLPTTGQEGATGAKAYAAAAKEAIRSAERIHGALKVACRVETALVPPDSAIFDHNPGHAKARRAAWSAIRSATSLRWIIPTTRPETIRHALPEDWIGKGYPNVCLGGIVDRPDRLAEVHQQLVGLPSHFRMLLFPSSQEILTCTACWTRSIGSSRSAGPRTLLK